MDAFSITLFVRPSLRCGVLAVQGSREERGAMGQDPPLHLAAMYNHLGVIEGLFSLGKVSVWRFDAQGRSGTGGVAWKRCERSHVAPLTETVRLSVLLILFFLLSSPP